LSWGSPAWLWAMLGVPVLLLIIAVSGMRHRSRMAAVFRGEMLSRVLPAGVRARRVVRDLLVLFGFVMTILALRDPRVGEKVFTMEQKGVDIVLLVDLSRSMDAKDVDPSRLERARREILDLVEMLEKDRVGMVIYAGGAYPRMPLTTDYEALRMLVEELDTATFQVQGSELGEAIRSGLKLLGARRGEAGQALLVLSDGEVHRPADALEAAADAARDGVRIFSMGIGDEAAPIPMGDGTFLVDRSGQTVLTNPTSQVLTDVARATGGAFVQSIAANTDMDQLYRDEIRGTLKAGTQGTVQRKTTESAFQWPLGAALLSFLLAAWLGDGRRPWGASAARAALVLLLALPVAANAASVAEGDELYRAGRYAEAVEVFTELTMERPNDADAWSRLAAAKYRAGDAIGAARAWEEQSRLEGGDADALFNAGNARYKAHQLEDAVRIYTEALQTQPGHPGATRNKAVVEQEIAARRQNPPKQPPKPKDGEDQQEGEGQDSQQSKSSDGQKEGEQKEGEQKPGESSDQAPQESDQQAKSKQPGESKEGRGDRQGQETSSQERDGQEGDPSEQVQLGDVQKDGQGAEGEVAVAGDGTDGPSGPMTAAQAERVLEGVEEGRPRVVVPGDAAEGKPW
jgi:Ca-activated chloride channel family protein